MSNLAISALLPVVRSCFFVSSAFCFLVLIYSVLVGGVSMVGLRLSLLCGKIMVCVPSIVFSLYLLKPYNFFLYICHSLFYVFMPVSVILLIFNYVITFDLCKKKKNSHSLRCFLCSFPIVKKSNVVKNYVGGYEF